jgi:hypothetical protein
VANKGIISKMMGKRHITAPAAEDEATTATLDKGSCPAAIEKQDDLFPVGHCLADSLRQGAAEQALVPCF